MSSTIDFDFNFSGVYQLPVYKVMLTKETDCPARTESIRKPGDVAEIVQRFLAGLDREYFIVIMLSIKFQILGINTVAIGGRDYFESKSLDCHAMCRCWLYTWHHCCILSFYIDRSIMEKVV